ncbi:MAG TPA: M20 family metallopeptidase [Anaerolineales bacterium]|nr:M20 family metallopeptidase [Anaerolineales bacterium]
MITQAEQAVLDRIDDDELIAWVQALTRIPSVWKPETGEGEAEAAAWVAERCRAIGIETHVEEVAPGRPNVVGWLRSPGSAHATYVEGRTPKIGSEDDHRRSSSLVRPRVLMFEGHTDVVTEGDPALWTDPPFSATLRDGKIYGRGANDMKAGLVCALIALKALKESGVALDGDIVLGAVCDEEGRMLGIKHFVERGWADHVTAAIVCEPEENHLCIAQKGVMWIRVVISGVMAHGAMPLTGVNAMYPMARFLTAVHALEEREIVRHGRHEFLGQPSITPTIVQSPVRGGGEPQNNVMPGAAECVLDFRLIPGQDADALAAAVETLLRAAVAVDDRLSYTCQVLEVRAPTATDPAEPVVRALAGAFTDLSGAAPIYGGVPGSTDGTILNARKGIPIVTCGPGDIHIPHHIDEWVSVEEIKVAARLYVLAAIRYLGHL